MASIDKVLLPSGKTVYKVRYRTPEGKSRKKTFALRRDADRYLVEVEQSKHSGGFVDPARGRVTVAQWAGIWLDGKAALAPATQDTYRSVIRTHILPKWGSFELAQLSRQPIQTWLAQLTLSPATIRKIHQALTGMLDAALKDGRISRNPADGVTLPKVTRPVKRYLTATQVERLAQAAGEWALLVRFLAYTGLRWGEATALLVSDLDLLRRRVTVSKAVKRSGGVKFVGPTKTYMNRRVAIPRWMIPELEQQIADKGPDSLIFPSNSGGLLDGRNFQHRVLDQACTRAAIERVTPHEFRHTAASLAIAAGADVKVLQQMLGHSSAAMTLDLYGHLFPDRLDEVADRMAEQRAADLASPSGDCVRFVSAREG